MRKDRNIYVADFETASEHWYKKYGRTFPWAFSLCNIYDFEKVITNYGKTGEVMQLFFDELEKMEDKSIIYFHNLKFDGKFIMSWLLEKQYKDVSSAVRRKMKDDNFKTLSDGSSWYSMTFTYKGKTYELRDSLKRIPMGVEKMAKEYKLETQKGKIDYNRDPKLAISQNELKYIENDVKIVAQVLKMQYDEGFTQLTTASYSFHCYIEWLKKKKLPEINKDREEKLTIDDLFPELDEATYEFIRRSYEGGEVYVNPDYQGRIIYRQGLTFDINSLYPAVYSTASLPIGQPIMNDNLNQHTELITKDWKIWNDFRGKDKRYFIEVKNALIEAKENTIPSVGVVSGFNERSYDENIHLVDVVLTDARWELVLRYYNVKNVKLGNLMVFEARNDLFFEYVQEIVKEKNEASQAGNIGRKNLAKIKLNSLYGKFGQAPNRENAKYQLDEKGVIKSSHYDTDSKGKYIPIASCICADAREMLITQCNKFKRENVYYTDTDSIHTCDNCVKIYKRREKMDLNDVLSQEEITRTLDWLRYEDTENIWIDRFDLGAFKIENEWSVARFVRPKCYIEAVEGIPEKNEDGEIIDEYPFVVGDNLKGIIKGAGIPEEQKEGITLDNYQVGLVLGGKLLPKTVKGGVILCEGEYELKEKRLITHHKEEMEE